MMKCPVCSKLMVEEDFGGVKVDVCKDGCHGLFFEWGELLKLDEKNEGLGEALERALQYPRYNDQNRPLISCPKCGIQMHAHKYPSAKEINVDECYQCGAFFLDSGELLVIRERFMSEKEREAYANKLMDELPEFGKAEEELAKQKLRTQAIRNYTRFLRVSYYKTGK